MYAVDEDTDELIRHRLGDDEPTVIGQLMYPDGSTADEVECLGYIRSGPAART